MINDMTMASLYRLFQWAVTDSNRRRRMPADLQSAPFVHFGNRPTKEADDGT